VPSICINFIRKFQSTQSLCIDLGGGSKVRWATINLLFTPKSSLFACGLGPVDVHGKGPSPRWVHFHIGWHLESQLILALSWHCLFYLLSVLDMHLPQAHTHIYTLIHYGCGLERRHKPWVGQKEKPKKPGKMRVGRGEQNSSLCMWKRCRENCMKILLEFLDVLYGNAFTWLPATAWAWASACACVYWQGSRRNPKKGV